MWIQGNMVETVYTTLEQECSDKSMSLELFLRATECSKPFGSEGKDKVLKAFKWLEQKQWTFSCTGPILCLGSLKPWNTYTLETWSWNN